MPPPFEPRPRLPTIQVLRALAALMVVVGHTLLELPFMHGDPGYLRPFYHAFGVSVFFVISGFIMAYTTEDEFGSARGRKDFIVSRLTRIVPIYWMLTSGVLVLSLIAPTIINSPAPTVGSLLNSYLFLPFNNSAGVPFPILAPGWSLDYEMYFYILFAAAMFLPRTTGLRVLVAFMVVMAVAGLLFQPRQELLQAWSNPGILRFVVGIGIAYYRVPLARLPRGVGLCSIALGVALYIPMNFVFDDNAAVAGLVETIAASAIVVGAAILDLGGKPIAPVLLVLIGDASYSLYLSHLFVVRAVRVAWNATHRNVEPILFCTIVLLIAVPVAMVMAAKIELPLHRRLRGMFVHRRQVTAPTALETRA